MVKIWDDRWEFSVAWSRQYDSILSYCWMIVGLVEAIRCSGEQPRVVDLATASILALTEYA